MRRRRVRPPAEPANGYEIGYGRPPKHTQFQPGQSGNPAGRRKGVRNLSTDVRRTLAAPVKVKEDGRTRNKSTQESMLLVLREKALRGDARALDRLLELAVRFNNDMTEVQAALPLADDDQAILDAYMAYRLPCPTSPADTPPLEEDKAGSRSTNTKVSK